MFGLSTTHLVLLLIIVVIIFGAGRLPQVGKQFGEAIKAFKKSVSDESKPEDKSAEDKDKPA